MNNEVIPTVTAGFQNFPYSTYGYLAVHEKCRKSYFSWPINKHPIQHMQMCTRIHIAHTEHSHTHAELTHSMHTQSTHTNTRTAATHRVLTHTQRALTHTELLHTECSHTECSHTEHSHKYTHTHTPLTQTHRPYAQPRFLGTVPRWSVPNLLAAPRPQKGATSSTKHMARREEAC